MQSHQNTEAVVAVCSVTAIVTTVLLTTIVFITCHQHIASVSSRLVKSISTTSCYRSAADVVNDNYGDSPCSKSCAAALMFARPDYSDNTTLRQIEIDSEPVPPSSSSDIIVVCLIDHKYSTPCPSAVSYPLVWLERRDYETCAL